jgi:hypothetical protein
MRTRFNNLVLLQDESDNMMPMQEALQEAKNFLKVSGNADDTQILEFMKQARKFAERFCNLSLFPQVYLVTYLSSSILNSQIILPRRFVTSINDVSFTSFSGAINVIDPDKYFFDQESQIFFLKINLNTDLLKIKFTTQIDNFFAEEFKMPLLQHINLLYKRRLPEGNANSLNFESEVRNLYRSYRLIGI